jgi:hypothetical protein
MLPVILIAAAAVLVTACESSSSSQKKATKPKIQPPPSRKPMEGTYTGFKDGRSSYRGESKSDKLMKRIDPFRPKRGKAKVSKKGPRPIGGDPAALPPPIEEWNKKCTDDGHKVGGRVLEGQSWSSMVCVSASGEFCPMPQYFDGRCTLD